MPVPRALAGRYAFTKRIRGTQRTIIWLARDQRTGVRVVASVLPGPRAAALQPAEGLRHIHAAPILRVIDHPAQEEVPDEEPLDPESRIVVAEYVEGRSLQQRLDAGPVATETAVEWIASVADALVSLHARGAVHGAVAPRALVVVRSEPAVVPILTHLIVPPSGAFCSPERVTGGGPSETDDAWALAATLYSALSRRAPFQGATRTELARAIVVAYPKPLYDIDAGLRDIVSSALLADPTARLSTAVGLRDRLREWMEGAGVRSVGDFAPVAALVGAEPAPNVGDLSLVAALASPESAEAMAPFRIDSAPPDDSPPPPDVEDITAEVSELEPPATQVSPAAPNEAPPLYGVSPLSPPKTSTRPVHPERERNWRAIALSLALVAAASAGVGVVTGKLRSLAKREVVSGKVREEPRAPFPSAPSPLGSSEPAPAPSMASDPPAAAAPPKAPGDVTSCVRGLLPPETLGPGGSTDLEYLCKEKDLWGIARKLDLTIMKHGSGPGMVLWAHLGRYDLAAIAMLITRCCPPDTVFAAANPKGVCQSLPASVEDIARNPSPENADRYAESVDCFISRGVRYPAEWWDRIGPKDARGYFDEYVRSMPKP